MAGSRLASPASIGTKASGLVFLRARYLQVADGRFISRDVWQGNPLRPGSMNGWNYVEGAPINYRDPSGMISEGEAVQADGIIDELATKYRVLIPKDYGKGCEVYQTDPMMRCTCTRTGWKDGLWAIPQLQLTENAVTLAANAMGGADRFQRAMKGAPVVISRWRDIKIDLEFWQYEVRPSAPAVVDLQGLLGDVVLNGYTFSAGELYATHTVIHELGHVWDVRTNRQLSEHLGWYIGTLEKGPFGYRLPNPVGSGQGEGAATWLGAAAWPGGRSELRPHRR